MKSKKRPLLKKYQIGTGWGGGLSSGTISTWQPSPNSPTAGNLSFADPGKYSNASVIPEGSMLEGKDLSGGTDMSAGMNAGIAGGISAGLGAIGSGIDAGAAHIRANTKSTIDPRSIYAYNPDKSIWATQQKRAGDTAAGLDAAGDVLNSIPLGFTQIIGAGLKVGASSTRMGKAALAKMDVEGHNEIYKEKRNIGGYRGNFTNQGQFTTYDDQESRPVISKMGGYMKPKYQEGGSTNPWQTPGMEHPSDSRFVHSTTPGSTRWVTKDGNKTPFQDWLSRPNMVNGRQRNPQDTLISNDPRMFDFDNPDMWGKVNSRSQDDLELGQAFENTYGNLSSMNPNRKGNPQKFTWGSEKYDPFDRDYFEYQKYSGAMDSEEKNVRFYSKAKYQKGGGYLDQYKGGGLYANIHAKRKRIKAGSGESMRSPGSKGAPTDKAFADSAKTAKMGMGGMLEYGKGGIYIDPAKRGTFKAQATKMNMGVQEAASKILSAPEGEYSPEMRKKANFAKNFAKEDGGYLKQYMGGGMATSTGVPRQYANAELEGGEIVEKQIGPDVYVKGASHEEGGVPMVLQEGGPAQGGDYVWSDHLTYKGKTMAEWYDMAVNNGASEQEIDQLRMLQEQLAGRAGEPQDAKELQEMPMAKNGGMLKKYKTGSAVGTRTFGERMGDYVPEIASGIGALAQTIAIATAENPYKGLQSPKEERVSTDKQFFERTDARAEMAQNERQATLSKQLLQQAGAGPSEIAALQKVDLERQAADATAVQRSREFNIQQDRAEKQLNTELKLRADMANQAAANEMAKLAYERDFGERMFETQRGQAIGDAVSGMAGDVAKYASDYRYAKAIQGKNLSKRASTYDRDKARAILESQNPWDQNKDKMTYAEWDAMIDQKVNEDAALHQKSMK